MASSLNSMRQLLSSLIDSGKVVTTEAKARILKRQVERLVSRSKKLDLPARRRVMAFLSGDKTAEKFLGQIVPQFKERVGGYVRVIKLPHRLGDNAPLARVEFVEEIKKATEEKKPAPPEKKTSRSRKTVRSTVRKPVKKENVRNKRTKK